MGGGSEWISPSRSDPTRPLLESTWDAPHMAEEVEVVVAAAAVVAAVAAVVRPGATQETMTGATTEATTEVMIVTMIVMMTGSTDHTDADLRLRITAEGTAPDPGPTRHVITEQ